VVGYGLEEGGELVVGLDWLGKKVKAGKSFIKLGKMGGAVLGVFEWNGEEGFEVGDAGGLGSAVFLLHHAMRRIRQQEGVS
jgi:hypothetical protein